MKFLTKSGCEIDVVGAHHEGVEAGAAQFDRRADVESRPAAVESQSEV